MDNDEAKKSKFNAGVALAERIDALQQAINNAWQNPLAFNINTGTHNYDVIINANESLTKETWGKLKPDEKKEADKIRNIIREFIKRFPPITLTSNGDKKINTDNYEKLKILMDLYEKKNKTFLDEHDLNSPNIDDEDGI